MTDKMNWQASLLEQRTAWGITFCAIIITMLAAAQPQWFDFSSSANKITHAQAPANKIIQPATHTAAEKVIIKKTEPVKTAPKIKTITPSEPVMQAAPKVEKSKPVTTVKPFNSITSGFYVQLGAFAEKARAQGLAAQLKRKGWSVKISTKKNGMHAVWIGPKSTKSEAEQLLKAIRSKLKQKGFIVQHNNG